MNLTPDSSIVLQIVTFIVLWAILKRLLFDPFAQVLEQREGRTTGAHAAASRTLQDVSHAREQHEQAIQAARAEIAQRTEAARKEAHEERERVVAAARNESAASMVRQRAALTQQVDSARRTLLAEAEGIAAEMMQSVVGRKAS